MSMTLGAIQQRADGSIILRLHIKPGARMSRLVSITESYIDMQVSIHAPVVEE